MRFQFVHLAQILNLVEDCSELIKNTAIFMSRHFRILNRPLALANRTSRRYAFMLLSIAFVVGCTQVQGTIDPVVAQATGNEVAWNALGRGGYAVLFRHSKTDTGNGETPNYQYGVCATERQLNQAGREQARLIGEQFKARNIRVREILSSAWCRCRDTAQLAFGRHTVWTPLNVINPQFNPKVNREKQTAEVMDRISKLEYPDNLVMVTHHINVEALTGEATSEGEGIVVRYDSSSRSLTVIGRLQF
jgi:phosphohistidine phosphatase SixA